jgi:hypothetical protein
MQYVSITHPTPLAGPCQFLYLTNRLLLPLFSYVSQGMMFNHTCAVQSDVCGACLTAVVTAAGVVVSGLPGSEGGIRTVFHRLRELPAQILSSSTQVGVTFDALCMPPPPLSLQGVVLPHRKLYCQSQITVVEAFTKLLVVQAVCIFLPTISLWSMLMRSLPVQQPHVGYLTCLHKSCAQHRLLHHLMGTTHGQSFKPHLYLHPPAVCLLL